MVNNGSEWLQISTVALSDLRRAAIGDSNERPSYELWRTVLLIDRSTAVMSNGWWASATGLNSANVPLNKKKQTNWQHAVTKQPLTCDCGNEQYWVISNGNSDSSEWNWPVVSDRHHISACVNVLLLFMHFCQVAAILWSLQPTAVVSQSESTTPRLQLSNSTPITTARTWAMNVLFHSLTFCWTRRRWAYVWCELVLSINYITS